jgi:polysaccharide pyruvyl transferase WcaK-like protein
MERTTKIGLLHHIGGGNLGDDTTFDVVVDNIKRRWPHAEISAFSMSPGDTTVRHGITSYPIRRKTWTFGYEPAETTAGLKESVKSSARKFGILFHVLRAVYSLVFRLPRECGRELSFLIKSRRLIRTFDLFIITGGGQLTEWGGPWGFPYTLFKWVLLGKSAGVKCIYLNVGAGPLDHSLSQLFVRYGLRLADYVSFRDEQSRALVRDLGFKGESRVFPDIVYSMEVPSTVTGCSRKTNQPVVGIAPMPYGDSRGFAGKQDQRVYEEYIRKLAIFAASVVRQSYSLKLFGTDIGVDPLAIEDLQRALWDHHGVVASAVDGVKSVDDLLVALGGMDYVVTSRYHGVVFAHLANRPVLAISHHPKVVKLMGELGLSQYCVEIEQFDPQVSIDTFGSMVMNAEEIKRSMAAHAALYKKELASQFDSLFPCPDESGSEPAFSEISVGRTQS